MLMTRKSFLIVALFIGQLFSACTRHTASFSKGAEALIVARSMESSDSTHPLGVISEGSIQIENQGLATATDLVFGIRATNGTGPSFESTSNQAKSIFTPLVGPAGNNVCSGRLAPGERCLFPYHFKLAEENSSAEFYGSYLPGPPQNGRQEIRISLSLSGYSIASIPISVTPQFGPHRGGTEIRGRARHLDPFASVLIGETPCLGLRILSAVEFQCTTPSNHPGTLPLTIINRLGERSVLSGAFQSKQMAEMSAEGEVHFGSVVQNVGSQKNTTLRIRGTELAHISSISLNGDNSFNIENSICNEMTENSTCDLVVHFMPNRLGPLNSTIEIRYLDGASEHGGTEQSLTIPISGNGVNPPELQLANENSYSFTGVVLEFEEISTNVELRNIGLLPADRLSLSGLEGTPFSLASSEGCANIREGNGTVLGNSSCRIRFRFHPTTIGEAIAPLTLTYFNGRESQTLQLTLVGTGLSPWVATPIGVFRPTTVGRTSEALVISVLNNHDFPIIAPTFSVSNTQDFLLGSNPPVIAAHGSYTLLSYLTPKSASANLRSLLQVFYSNGKDFLAHEPLLTLDGIGLSPAAIQITSSIPESPSVIMGDILTFRLTLQNRGESDAKLISPWDLPNSPFSFPGNNALYPGEGGDCADSLNASGTPGDSCDVFVSFSPTERSPFDDTLSFRYQDGSGSEQSVAITLHGVGIDPPPVLTRFSPNSGRDFGGNIMVLEGAYFRHTPLPRVKVGELECLSVTALEEHKEGDYATQLQCVIPPHPPGSVKITVIPPNGQAVESDALYSFIANKPPHLSNIANQRFDELAHFTIGFEDANGSVQGDGGKDIDGDRLSFQCFFDELVDGLVQNSTSCSSLSEFSFNAESRQFKREPHYLNPRLAKTYEIKITATDGYLVDTKLFQVSVDLNPVIPSITIAPNVPRIADPTNLGAFSIHGTCNLIGSTIKIEVQSPQRITPVSVQYLSASPSPIPTPFLLPELLDGLLGSFWSAPKLPSTSPIWQSGIARGILQVNFERLYDISSVGLTFSSDQAYQLYSAYSSVEIKGIDLAAPTPSPRVLSSVNFGNLGGPREVDAGGSSLTHTGERVELSLLRGNVDAISMKVDNLQVTTSISNYIYFNTLYRGPQNIDLGEIDIYGQRPLFERTVSCVQDSSNPSAGIWQANLDLNAIPNNARWNASKMVVSYIAIPQATAETNVQKVAYSNVVDVPSPKVGGHDREAISISGDMLISGNDNVWERTVQRGRAYIYKRDANGAWALAKELVPPPGNGTEEGFGSSVVMTGNNQTGYRALVGAPLTQFRSGRVYLYESYFDDNGSIQWRDEPTVFNPQSGALSYYGLGLAMEGERLVIGGPGPGLNTGVCEVRKYNADTRQWEIEQLLTPNDTLASSFCVSVSISGNTIAVGSYSDGAGRTGSAYVFKYDLASQRWVQNAQLLNSFAVPGDGFGWSIACSSNRVIVGAPFRNGTSGSSYIYEFNGNTWEETVLAPARSSINTHMHGRTVALSGNVALVGGMYRVMPTTNYHGEYAALFIYDPNTRKWQESDTPATQRGWGGVSISGNEAVVQRVPFSNTQFRGFTVFRIPSSQ